MSEKTITWFRDSPDAGPACTCSLCGKPILDEQIPIRCWDDENPGWEARFHFDPCFAEVRQNPEQYAAVAGERTCRVCGCTDAWGCPEGCYWVEDDLCSSCDGAGEADQLDLGPCCACGREGATVRNLIMLGFTAPVAGTGWGCLQCGLSMDGATAVICDDCLAAETPIQFVIAGQAAQKGRISAEEAQQQGRPFEHNMQLHPEVTGDLN